MMTSTNIYYEPDEREIARRAIERAIQFNLGATVFTGLNKHGVLTYYARKRSNEHVIRGLARSGIRAKDFIAECDYKNETTAPLVEVPASIIRSMRMETKLTAVEDALYWRLFAQARFQGITQNTYTIGVTDLKRYLGIANTARLLHALKNINEAVVSYHFNHAVQNGRKSMKLVDIHFTDEQLDKLHFKQTISFSLPKPVRAAVEACREYAWVSINALSRFRSRFSRPLYMRMALMSGRHTAFRKGLEYTRDQIIDVLDLPKNAYDVHIDQALDFAERDIERLPKATRRFTFDVFRPNESNPHYEYIVSGSLRGIRDCKARSISNDEAAQILDPKTNRIASNEYPTLLLIRKAATLHGVSPVAISTAYRQALNAVRHKPDARIAGICAFDFFKIIRLCGADEAFAYFADTQDLSVFKLKSKRLVLGEQVRRHDKLVFVPYDVETVEVESEYEHEDDLRTASDFGDFEDHDIPSQMCAPYYAPEVDDEEIPF